MRTGPEGDLVLRRSRSSLRRSVIGSALVSPSVVIPMAIAFGVPGLLWSSLGCGTVLAAGHLAAQRHRIVLTRNDLRREGLFWRRVWARAAVGGAVRVLLHPPPRSAYARPILHVFILTDHGARLTRITDGFFAREDIDTLLHHLRVPITEVDGLLTVRELAQRDPRLILFPERRPVITALLFVAAVIITALFTAVALR